MQRQRDPTEQNQDQDSDHEDTEWDTEADEDRDSEDDEDGKDTDLLHEEDAEQVEQSIMAAEEAEDDGDNKIELQLSVTGHGDKVKSAIKELLRELKGAKKDQQAVNKAMGRQTLADKARFAQGWIASPKGQVNLDPGSDDIDDEDVEASDDMRDERLVPSDVLNENIGVVDLIHTDSITLAIHTGPGSVKKCLDQRRDSCLIMVCSHDREECRQAVRMFRGVSEELSATGTRCVVLDHSRKKVQRLMDDQKLFLNEAKSLDKPSVEPFMWSIVQGKLAGYMEGEDVDTAPEVLRWVDKLSFTPSVRLNISLTRDNSVSSLDATMKEAKNVMEVQGQTCVLTACNHNDGDCVAHLHMVESVENSFPDARFIALDTQDDDVQKFVQEHKDQDDTRPPMLFGFSDGERHAFAQGDEYKTDPKKLRQFVDSFLQHIEPQEEKEIEDAEKEEQRLTQ